jgi:hypothetical protein
MFAKPTREESSPESKQPRLAPQQRLLSGQVFHMAPSDALALSDPPGHETREADVVEIRILLPAWQAAALEEAAHDFGLTAGEMLRHLLADALPPPHDPDMKCDLQDNRSEVEWG